MSGLLTLASTAAEHAAGTAAAAAHGPQHTELIDTGNWLPGVTALVVFLLAFGFLYWKVWPKIMMGLDAREKKIRDEIAAAEAAREEARAALGEYQANLARAQEEASQMISKARADAKAVADELRSRNEADLAEMKQRATREIEVARQAAVSSLYAEASSLAVSIAGKILQREVTSRDQEVLVNQSLKELAEAGKN